MGNGPAAMPPRPPASPTSAPPPTGPRRGTMPPPATGPRREAPERPGLASAHVAPVVAKAPPPFTVRMSQFLWVLSFAVGAVAIVFYFVIREDQLPLIADVIRGVVADRSDETYDAGADILYWSLFGLMVGILLVQITLLVSFSGRKRNIRWWQLGTLILLVVTYLLGLEFVGTGDYGAMLEQLFIAQGGLAILGLLFSTFPNALRWTARKVDVRPAGSAPDIL